jgi:DNA primase
VQESSRNQYYEQFVNNLKESQTVQDYLIERGFNIDFIKSGNFGFCSSYSKYMFPLLRGRVIVPINDCNGNLIALAGRQFKPFEDMTVQSFWDSFGNEPAKAQDRVSKWRKGKWLNEPYQKSKHLFNLDKAKKDIRKNNLAYIVEGYFDALILSSLGITNVVATCGTALSEHHLALLFRYCDQVVLMLDGDEAGILASEKMLDKIENNEMIGYRLVLPEKYDPDSFLLEFGVDIFKDIIVKLLANENRIMKIKI